MCLKKPLVLALVIGLALAGCAHTRPPDAVVKAIHIVNHYTPSM